MEPKRTKGSRAKTSASVIAYWDSEKSMAHREKLKQGMKNFWSKIKR